MWPTIILLFSFVSTVFHLQQVQRKKVMAEVKKHFSSPMCNMVILASVAEIFSRGPECSKF